MAASANGNGDDAITAINVTPLVDITLVLLIIFMVTATFIVTPSIKVELPKAVTAESSDPQTFSIVISKEGLLFLNGSKTSEDKIVEYIQRRVANTPDLQVVISADKYVYHGDVVHMIDVVRRNGVAKFAINVEAEAEEK
jgi:biopolymer transport protein ExbD